MNIHSSFIKIWEFNIAPQSLSSIRHNTSIPQYIRIIITNNGSFTRNNSILHKQLTKILLIQQYKENYTEFTPYTIIKPSNRHKRQVWLINDGNKKKFYLQNLILMKSC
uniref:Uncharacterized protein n=1 Tax=Izziella formosana TaxID=1653389 RepID=A0A1G4NUX0_9FLOR|nr:Hypothetical protein ORF_7 [Izziella formosana]SCW22316.1 Hypothetical protein ORF_7 [Izziella formosana]